MNLPYLLVPNELSDEAAAHIAELLHDLAIAFDNQYFAQIQRHYQISNDSSTTNPSATKHSSNSSNLPTGRSEPSSAPTESPRPPQRRRVRTAQSALPLLVDKAGAM